MRNSTVKIAFQTFDSDKQTLKDMLMATVVRGIYYHCEIHFSDGSVGFAGNKKRGVVLTSNQDKDYQNGNWEFLEIPCSPKQEEIMKSWFIKNQNKKYNWMGIFGTMIAGLNISYGDGKFCSEACFESMFEGGVLSNEFNASELSPTNLYNILRKLSWKEVDFCQ